MGMSTQGEGGEGEMMPGERWQQTQWLQTKVFVRGLPYSLTEEDVYTMFGKVSMRRDVFGRGDGVQVSIHTCPLSSECWTPKNGFNSPLSPIFRIVEPPKASTQHPPCPFFSLCTQVGGVVKVRGMVRRDDGRPSGVAWVEFEDEEAPNSAKKVFDGKTFRGRYLEVRTRKEREGNGRGLCPEVGREPFPLGRNLEARACDLLQNLP